MSMPNRWSSPPNRAFAPLIRLGIVADYSYSTDGTSTRGCAYERAVHMVVAISARRCRTRSLAKRNFGDRRGWSSFETSNRWLTSDW